MLQTSEHEKIQKALKTAVGCQNLKAEVSSLYRLSFQKQPPNIDVIERIVTICEYALFELIVARTLEDGTEKH